MSTQASFPLGSVFMTAGVQHYCELSHLFHVFAVDCLSRHHSCDWSEMDPEDQATNQQAIAGGSRIFSSYAIPPDLEVDQHKVWVITEHDRSVTTVLFPGEY